MKKVTIFLFVLVAAFASLSFIVRRSIPKKYKSKFAFVTAGKVFVGKDSMQTKDFFISKYEITNADYSEFLDDLAKNGRKEELKSLLIDSAGWRTMQNEPFVNTYHHHPAFRNYPVVNVSYEMAVAYCQWQTENISKLTGYKNLFLFRLPTRAEWIRAARGDNYERTFAWARNTLQNSKGGYLCNLGWMSDENIHYNDSTGNYEVINKRIASDLFGDNSDMIAPVKWYYQNDFGLFNMNGNVSEMVYEKGIAVGGNWNSTGYDVRNESLIRCNGSSPMIGFRPVLVIN